MKIDPQLKRVLRDASRARTERMEKLRAIEATCRAAEEERAPLQRKVDILSGKLDGQIAQWSQQIQRAAEEERSYRTYARELEQEIPKLNQHDSAGIEKRRKGMLMANDTVKASVQRQENALKQLNALRAEQAEIEGAVRAALDAEKQKAIEAAFSGDFSQNATALTFEHFRDRTCSLLKLAIDQINKNPAFRERDALRSRPDEVQQACSLYFKSMVTSAASWAPMRDFLAQVEATLISQNNGFKGVYFVGPRLLQLQLPLASIVGRETDVEKLAALACEDESASAPTQEDAHASH